MCKDNNEILYHIYAEIKNKVDRQLERFEYLRNYGTEEEIFEELVFCLLTPQSKARMAEKTIERLKSKGMLFKADFVELSQELNLVRFKNHKANYIIEAQKKFIIKGKPTLKSILNEFIDANSKRQWLVENIKGFGMKEASHFLRNIGYYFDVAILDRHIIKNLSVFCEIEKPTNLNQKSYLLLENRMKDWAKRLNIPFEYLDFILWYKETGDVFK